MHRHGPPMFPAWGVMLIVFGLVVLLFGILFSSYPGPAPHRYKGPAVARPSHKAPLPPPPRGPIPIALHLQEHEHAA